MKPYPTINRSGMGQACLSDGIDWKQRAIRVFTWDISLLTKLLGTLWR